jgi:hypothetical protein
MHPPKLPIGLISPTKQPEFRIPKLPREPKLLSLISNPTKEKNAGVDASFF